MHDGMASKLHGAAQFLGKSRKMALDKSRRRSPPDTISGCCSNATPSKLVKKAAAATLFAGRPKTNF